MLPTAVTDYSHSHSDCKSRRRIVSHQLHIICALLGDFLPIASAQMRSSYVAVLMVCRQKQGLGLDQIVTMTNKSPRWNEQVHLLHRPQYCLQRGA